MNHITIVIPTRNRWERLRAALGSCLEEPNVDIVVVCDDDAETLERLKTINAHNLAAFNVTVHSGATFCRNKAMHTVSDGLLYATDDITFEPGAIKAAMDTFNDYFADDDGVIGFTQDQPHHPTGVALMGRVFRGRYPDGKPFFPAYWHFAAQEVYWLASALKKFAIEPKAAVKHLSPNQFKDLMDQTHIDARLRKGNDMRLKAERKSAGLIYGMESTNVV